MPYSWPVWQQWASMGYYTLSALRLNSSWGREMPCFLAGRRQLSDYIDYDDYEASTAPDTDDDTQRCSLRHQPSTSRLYDRPAAAATGCDVIDQVMECNQPTPRQAPVDWQITTRDPIWLKSLRAVSHSRELFTRTIRCQIGYSGSL